MSLRIIYSLIARGSKLILTDYTDYSGNFLQIALLVLRKLKKENKCELLYDNYTFYSHDEDDLTYICLAEDMKSEVAFSFLLDLKKRFLSTYDLPTIKDAYSYKFKDFGMEIKAIINFYEENQYYTQPGVLQDKDNNRILIIKGKAEDLFDKNDKLELVAKKAMKTKETVDDFQSKMDIIRRKQKAKYIKYAMLLFILITLISIILWLLSKLF